MKTILLTALVLLNIAIVNAQNIYINEVWNESNGIPTPSRKEAKSAIDPSGNIVYVSSNDNGTDTDIFLSCVHPSGSLIWDQTCASSAQADWGVDIAIDGSGNIYICGVENNGINEDYFVAKYEASGTLLWQFTFDNGGDDRPAALTLDGLGGVIVTGTSVNGSSMTDFATLKFDASTGSLLWTSFYDYVGLAEMAVDMEVDGLGNPIVLGTSAQSFSDSEFTLIKYNTTTGASIATLRDDSPGTGYDLPSEMFITPDNRIYVTGSSNSNLTNSELKTMRLDLNLTLLWTDYIDVYGLQDHSNGLVVSSTGDIAITGYAENLDGGTEFITIGYNDAGTATWIQRRLPSDVGSDAKGSDITVDQDDHFIVTGFIEEGGTDEFRTASYDNTGQVRWEKTFAVAGRNAQATQVISLLSDVVVIGNVMNAIDRDFTVVKYQTKERSTDIIFDSLTGDAVHTEHELIVKVDPKLVNTAMIDDLGYEFWSLDEIFTPTFVSDVHRALEGSCQDEHCDVTVYRIFKRMQTKDSLSVTRSGDIIPIPKLWSTFVFAFPDGVDVTAASNGLMTLFPQIPYSTYNLIGKTNTVPNDSLYDSEQITFHPDPLAFWPDNHIDAEKAWELETGKRWVKIGIVDIPGMDWTHPDFGGGTETTTKVDGWDFKADMSVYDAPLAAPINSHATAVGGITGAIRNNLWGIAGVAGGSYETSDDLDSSGCKLYSMNVAFTFDEPIVDYIANAIVESSVFTPGSDYGFGLHAMNCSWGVSQVDPFWFLDTNILLLREAFHVAHRNEVTVVATRGNSGDFQTARNDHDNYPGVLDEDWIICVGGTGNDGMYHDGIGALEYGYSTSRGNEIDVSMCSAGSHNWTTRAGGTWNIFSGTSAAAPHVTGTVGLMMSYLNNPLPDYNNLAPEDCEQIMEMTALDTDFPGYDSLTGWGIVQAGDAMYQVHKDKYELVHFGTDAFPHTLSLSTYSTNDTVTLSERYQNAALDWFMEGVPYVVNTFEITAVSGHGVGTNQSIIASWPRASSSNIFAVYDANNIVVPRERVVLNSVTNINANLTGYVYEVFDTLGNPLGWWPFSFDDPLNPIDMTYSLLLDDTTAFLNNEELESDNSITVYPNPTNDSQTLVLTLDQPTTATIRLLDMNGRLLQEIYSGNVTQGRTTFEIDLSNISKGFYVYSIALGEEKIKHLKIIKQ